MNLKTSNRQQSGSALIITLAIAGAIGFALASYLFLVSSQNGSVVRSMAWNSAMPMIEAGIEEALTHIHTDGVTNLSRNGWMAVRDYKMGELELDGTYYIKYRKTGDGYYATAISQASPPVIFSAGYARVPMQKEKFLPPRIVRVRTRRDSMFPMGMVAKGRVDLNGNNVRSDSFDSTDPSKSTGGLYDPAKFNDQGDVASNSGITGIFNQGNADIYGHIGTGPGGSVTLGPNGAAGSKAWIDAGNNGIQAGYFNDDMNVSFPDVALPFTSGYSTPAGNPVTINSSGNYQISSITKSLVVKSNVQAVLIVTSTIKISGQDAIIIEPGASLKLYMDGASASIAGKGVANASGNAANFSYYGTTNNTSITFSGNGEFAGTIYAPQADFKLNGGGAGVQDFIGASVTGTVTMNGSFNFHYDENLGRTGPDRGFVITSWNEI